MPLLQPGCSRSDVLLPVDLRRRPVVQGLVQPLVVVEGEVPPQTSVQLRHRLVTPQVHVLMLERVLISRHSDWALFHGYLRLLSLGRGFGCRSTWGASHPRFWISYF